MISQYKYISGDYNRSIIIGDIHGCFAEFQSLLNNINFCDSAFLISVGDMVDRGPDSWRVVLFFKNTINAHSVMGNHERRIAGVIRGTSQVAWSQLHTLSKIDDDLHDSWATHFESLPAVIETKHPIITHARLDPRQNIDNQDLYFTSGVGGKKVKIELDEYGIPIWFNQWSLQHGNVKPICVGHIEYKTVELVPKRLFALDTKAAEGGFLSAIIFPTYEIVGAKSKNNYYRLVFNIWKSIIFFEI